MKKIHLILFIFCTLFNSKALAQNPYMPLWEHIPDGEPYVFEDPDNPGKYRVYVYGSHDLLKKYYCGRDQVVWSASVDDLRHWRCDGVIFELKKNANGEYLHKDSIGDVLYAPDVALRIGSDGKKTYYLYPNVQDKKRGSLVAKSDRPDGPFVPCNWSKEDPDSTVGPFGFDPAAFVDDDGRAYGYWGFSTSYGAELDTATMATVKPGTEIVKNMITGKNDTTIYRFFEASSIRKIKDKYVFIYSRWTRDGDFGLPHSNYTLAYCYSNNPLGPWTYGGTIIDARGREKTRDGRTVETACINGNTHGSICQINGKWWVFYHRQQGTDEYSRQAMVAPIDVEVKEGKDGYVRISEGELTSEGFVTEGLDPLTRYSAAIACYYTGPEHAYEVFPKMYYSGSYPQDSAMVNNTAGSVFGYKYFNFSRTYGKKDLCLSINCVPAGIKSSLKIYIDRPTETDGGKCIGEYAFDSKTSTHTSITIPTPSIGKYKGKHAIFFVWSSPTKRKSLCTVNDFCFTSK